MNKFTSFLKKRKAFVIVALIGMIFGFTVLGTTQEDINKLKAEKTTVLAKIDSSKEELSTLNKDISDLKEKINQLNDEKQKQEQLLKDTTAKVELKQKEEAEKQRQAEIEKQKEANSISQSYSNNSSKKSTSNNSSNAKSDSYNSDNPHPSKPVGEMVYITATGKKYHRKNKCGNTNPARTSYIPLSEAESMGYTPCSKCY